MRERREVRRVVRSLLLAGAISTTASAATEGSYVIRQPIVAGDEGVTARPVTFVYLGDLWAGPGWTVTRTVSENCIATSNGFADRNAAHLAGLTVTLVPHPGPPKNMVFAGLFGDTLRAALDVSAAIRPRGEEKLYIWGYSLDTILPVTVECFLQNLAQEYPRIRFLMLDVSGGDEYAYLSATYPIHPLGERPEAVANKPLQQTAPRVPAPSGAE
jgi:hypothetical protein